MLAEFGFGVLVLTFLVTLFSIAAAVTGYARRSELWVERARRSMQLTFPLISASALTLLYLLASVLLDRVFF